MGLVNRLTEPGQALGTALELAEQLSRLPQRCMREDRLSAYEQAALPLDEALRNEFRHGMASLSSPEFVEGLRNFAAGAGRHGGEVKPPGGGGP